MLTMLRARVAADRRINVRVSGDRILSTQRTLAQVPGVSLRSTPGFMLSAAPRTGKHYHSTATKLVEICLPRVVSSPNR